MPSINETAKFLFCSEDADMTLIVERYDEDVRIVIESNGNRWEDANVTINDLRVMANVIDRIVTNAETHPFAKTSKAKLP